MEDFMINVLLVLAIICVLGGVGGIIIYSFQGLRGRPLEEKIHISPLQPPPLPIELRPKKLYCEWICFYGVWFRKKEIKCLTENPNKTINIVMDGVKYNTGMDIDELMIVLTESSEDARAVLNQRKKTAHS